MIKKKLHKPHSLDSYYTGHCTINFYFMPSHATTDEQHSPHLLTYILKDKSLKISQYATEEQKIWWNTWITVYGTKEKKWLLRLWPWEKSIVFQHLAINSMLSTGRTHQLNVSFLLLWGTSEHSTQHMVSWLIPTAPDEGDQAVQKGKIYYFLHFSSLSHIWPELYSYFNIYMFKNCWFHSFQLNFKVIRKSHMQAYNLNTKSPKLCHTNLCIDLSSFILKQFRSPPVYLKCY